MKKLLSVLILALALFGQSGCASPATPAREVKYQVGDSPRSAGCFAANPAPKKRSWLRNVVETSLVMTAQGQGNSR